MDKIKRVIINDEQLERAMKEGTKRAMKSIFEQLPPEDPEEYEQMQTFLIMASAFIYCETSKLLGLSEV